MNEYLNDFGANYTFGPTMVCSNTLNWVEPTATLGEGDWRQSEDIGN